MKSKITNINMNGICEIFTMKIIIKFIHTYLYTCIIKKWFESTRLTMKNNSFKKTHSFIDEMTPFTFFIIINISDTHYNIIRVFFKFFCVDGILMALVLLQFFIIIIRAEFKLVLFIQKLYFFIHSLHLFILYTFIFIFFL